MVCSYCRRPSLLLSSLVYGAFYYNYFVEKEIDQLYDKHQGVLRGPPFKILSLKVKDDSLHMHTNISMHIKQYES